MRYIEALENLESNKAGLSVFLAGGITSCPDWQQELVQLLQDTDLTCLNPRRANFPMADPTAASQQITWEHQHLRLADAISFWFCAEALQPITLYELGAWSMTNKPLFVGIHPDYPRRQDVEIQTNLARPDIKIVDNLSDLAGQIKLYSSSKQ
jgi:hypothetical protein